MGIEDFNVDTHSYSDRVLVISEDTNAGEKLCELLKKRSYHPASSTSVETASQLSKDSLFDLIIFDCKLTDIEPDEILRNLKADPRLRRSPVIILHPNPNLEEIAARPINHEFLLLKSPIEPTQLLVKVAMQLRLRKLKTEQASFDSKIAAQNAELRDLTNRFRQELLEARSIQRAILPKKLPLSPHCDFGALYVPLEAVGGDLYDIWEITEDVYGFFIGDVTGHGLPAAFIGAMTKMAQAYAQQSSPDEMLSQMGAVIADLLPQSRFITVLAAFYNAKTGELSVARGGHPPALLWRKKTNEVEILDPKGLPLGIIKEAKYQLLKTVVEPGDKFLMLTDGLTETSNMDGKMLGVEGVAEIFKLLAPKYKISELLPEILKQQNTYSDGRILKDDNTLVGFARVI